MRRFALALALLVPALALADRRELYTQVGVGPSFLVLRDAAEGKAPGTLLALGLEASAYYGLTNELHVGGVVRAALGRDAAFQGVHLQQRDGSELTGALYEDPFALGAAALLVYRVSTGSELAPLARLELGVSHHRYSRLLFVPAGTTLGVDLLDASETSLGGRLTLALEYRFLSTFVASLGASAQASLGGSRAPWRFELPFTVGVVW